MPSVTEVISQIESHKEDDEFLSTGFPAIDQELDGGFIRKELVVIGADTGIGKSAVAGQLLFNIAQQSVPCAYFSLEMANDMVVARLMGSISQIKPTRIRFGRLDFDELNERLAAKSLLSQMAGFLDFYDDKYTLKELVETIKAHTYGFVVIDFIQNVMIPGMDEYARLGMVALELQKLAKEKNCCILVLSQLSNTMAKADGDARIEYKGSGSIATVCDLGFLLTREQNPLVQYDKLTLNLKKNRRGVSRMRFELTYQHPGGWIK